MGLIIHASERFRPRRQQTERRRPRQKSQYELYPLPFFNAKASTGPCTWDVTPTGDYAADCEIGHSYAVEFLRSCDGTVGWSSLLACITADMIRAGTDGVSPDGHPRVNGTVVGFMSTIGRELCSAYARLLS
jgi:hypothetical protein